MTDSINHCVSGTNTSHNQKPVIPTEVTRRLFFALVPRSRRVTQRRDRGTLSTAPRSLRPNLASRAPSQSLRLGNHLTSTKNLSSRPKQPDAFSFTRVFARVGLRSGGTCFFCSWVIPFSFLSPPASNSPPATHPCYHPSPCPTFPSATTVQKRASP
jgi:hypothetical protein